MKKVYLVAFVACAILPQAFAADAKIEGKFAVDGKEIPLTHVLAVDFDDAEGMGDGPEIRILFSATEIPQAELESPILFNLDALARAGKLQGILFRFDPKAETPELHGTTYATLDNPQTSMPFFTLGGDAGGADTVKVEGENLTGSVEGSAEGDADFGTPSYAYQITFSAPVKKSTPVKVLMGKEAMETTQMKTYLQFEDAMRKGDLDTVKKMTTPEKGKQVDDFVAQAGKDQFLAMVKQMMPDPATREKNLKGLYIRGNTTTIVFDDQGGKMSVNLVKKGDARIMN